MKKISLFSCLLLLICNMDLFAQGNEIDAFTISNTDLGGTARSVAIAGAFGSLGGDISVISQNPAGLGIYRSSEISGTLDLSTNKTSTSWNGINMNRNDTRFTPFNFGFELYFPAGTEGISNWNLGFSHNRVKNFNRKYGMLNNGLSYSMADYVAWRASNAFGPDRGIPENDLIYEKGVYDPYNEGGLAGHWLSILGYESGMYGNMLGQDGLYHSAFGEKERDGGDWIIHSPNQMRLSVNESGYMDEYNVGFGMNISNFLFLGASLTMTDLNYKYSSFYEEYFTYDNTKDDELYLENWLNTEGSAVSINVGAIVNMQILRLGVAYNSPRWYNMTDYYDARAGTYINGYSTPEFSASIPENSYSEYKFSTPGKWIFSGSIILGSSALISADYELVNYNDMYFSSKDEYGGEVNYDANRYIDEDYTWSQTLKLGAEVKITPRFAVRAGYMMQTSPMRKALVNNDVEVLPAGTIPHFTVTSKPTNYYTAGLGYRFTSNFYMDLACVYRQNESDAYAFSNTYKTANDVVSMPATLRSNTTRMVLTLGYKF
ncbi:MAG: outer membrane protein transport protein [Tannerella sp.]|nr:outer membrane protein transport protein [Tannerella sp.]